MSFAYWDGGKLKLGFKVGKAWRYKRVPQEIKALEKSEPDRAFELAKKLAEEIDRQSAAAIETWGSDHVTLRMFLKKFIDDRRSAGLVSVDDDESAGADVAGAAYRLSQRQLGVDRQRRAHQLRQGEAGNHRSDLGLRDGQ